MKGIIVMALFAIAVVRSTNGAPVETEAAASASTAKQPQIAPVTTIFANPSASTKSSITDHPRHKRRRHHRRRHKLHRHRHKLYPLKDRLQKFVGGSSETTSNLLASVKTPRQDFEMTNGEVFEHGGVPDLSQSPWTPQLVRSLPKYRQQHKSSLTDRTNRRTMTIGTNSDKNITVSKVVQNNATAITNDSSTKAKVYWDHTSRLINYLVKSYKDAIEKAPEETHNITTVKTGENNGTIHRNLVKPPSNPSPEPDEQKTANSTYTNKEIQEMKKIQQPEEDVKEPDSKQAIEPKNPIQVEEEKNPASTLEKNHQSPINPDDAEELVSDEAVEAKIPMEVEERNKPASISMKNHQSPINPDDININDIVDTSNAGAVECSSDDDETCGETGKGEEKIHYDKKTTSKESEAQFESAFQNRIDKFVADKTFSAKPLFRVGDEEDNPCLNQDVDNNDADTRGTPCTAPHRQHHRHYNRHHSVDQYYHQPQMYNAHIIQRPKHWSDLNDKHPLQMHLYNNTNDDYPHYSTDYGSHYDSHAVAQQEFVANAPPLFTHPTPPPRLPNTALGTLENARPVYPPVGNVQTPITFGGYTVTGTQPDPQHNQVHLYTGPRQVHLFKAYNTSEISMNTKQQLQQILNKDIQTPHRDMCHGNECSGGVQLAGEGFIAQGIPPQPYAEAGESDGGFHEAIRQKPGDRVQMHQKGDMNQTDELDDGDHGYHNEDIVERRLDRQ